MQRLTVLLVTSMIAGTALGQFTPGKLIVLRVGDGSAALTGTSAAVFLDQFDTLTPNQIAPSFSFSMPITGTERLTVGGSSTSEGFISLNPVNNQIMVPGYDAGTGISAIAATTSAAVNRVVNAVAFDATTTSRAAVFTTSFSGGNIRSTYAQGPTVWAAGSNTGVATSGSGPETVVSSTNANNRVIASFNGNLYFSAAAGTRGLHQVGTGLPTSSGTSSTNIIPIASGQPSGFAMSPDGNTVYVADERSTTTPNTGGIEKWTFNGTTWSIAGTFTGLSGTSGARGLAVDFSGTNPVLYATTTDSLSKLVALTDTGSNYTDAFTVLATANTNTAFRSVVFAPVPEPASILAVGCLASFGLRGARRLRRGRDTAKIQ